MAVVKIHSSRHVCFMLIGIVVVPLYFTTHRHCILKVGKFSRACLCRAFLQSLLSCLVHPYLLRNLFQLLFYSFRQVRFWAWIGATKMDPLGGAPSVFNRSLDLPVRREGTIGLYLFVHYFYWALEIANQCEADEREDFIYQ